MDSDLRNRLNYEAKQLRHDRTAMLSRLDALEPYRNCSLKKSSRRNGGSYYYMRTAGSSKYSYVPAADSSRVLRVKEAAHLGEAIHRIDNDIMLINALLDNYAEYDLAAVNSVLSPAYRMEERVLSGTYSAAGAAWKTERTAFQTMFPDNYPENKTERTSDGVLVRSKNELIIYEKLLSAGLYFIYELPFAADDHGPPMYPDFTVLSPQDMYSEIIIEHVGRLDDRRYREEFARRIKRYIDSGYIPGVNLFFTFNDRYGHLDVLQITKVTADIVGFR